MKTSLTQQNGTHQASHGYTESLESAHLVSVKASGSIKADSVKGVWPQGLQQEGIQGSPADLGQGFVTWGTSE